MKITGNEPTMPIVSERMTSSYATTPHSMLYVQSNGLTIRQHFAALAMQGILAKESWAERIMTEGGEATLATDIAGASVKMADTLIAELNKEA